MNYREPSNETIRIYFPFVLALIGAAVTWGVFTTRLSANEQRITALEVTQSKVSESLTQLQVSVGHIETSVSFIKDKVR